MIKYAGLAFLLSTAFAGGAYAQPYDVDSQKSSITFSGVHAGNAFSGVFKTWQAEVDFDPEDLAVSTIRTTIQTATAHTGNKMYDGTLPTPDWFDVKNHPEAIFESQTIAHKEGDVYTVDGILTIREQAVPVSFDVLLPADDLAKGQIETAFSIELDRLAFGIGKKSDAAAEWVSQNIGLEVKLHASRK